MVWLAEKTLALIEQNLERDNCGQFRQNLKTLLPKMEDAYRGEEKPFRKHLGASGIGDDCSRKIQLRWRWTQKPSFPPRVLRLFNRGHLEEARFLSMLMCIPEVKLWYETEDGGQFKWSFFNGHYGSALDGIARNIPDIPNGEACYTEFKTSNDAGFKKLLKEGVREVKHEHYVQMQECMLAYKLKYSLYLCVNKNDDAIYGEIVEYDHDTAMRYHRRAQEIIFTTEALPRMSNNPTFWKCKFCDVRSICHGKAIPEINCRTCCHWSPERDGTYSCTRKNDEVFSESAMVGCAEHVFDPTLLPRYEYLDADAQRNAILLKSPEGEEFWHGPNDVCSKELREQE